MISDQRTGGYMISDQRTGGLLGRRYIAVATETMPVSG